MHPPAAHLSPLVNLNRGDEPMARVTEAELLHTIAESADADTDFGGLGCFDTHAHAASGLPPYRLAAEACSELLADGDDATARPAPRYGLDELLSAWPLRTGAALVLVLLLALGVAGQGELELELIAAEAAEQLATAASEGAQP